jgi:hypothetical protein
VERQEAVLRLIIKAHGCSLCPTLSRHALSWVQIGKVEMSCHSWWELCLYSTVALSSFVLLPKIAVKQNKTGFSMHCNPANYVPAFVVTEENIQLHIVD